MLLHSENKDENVSKRKSGRNDFGVGHSVNALESSESTPPRMRRHTSMCADHHARAVANFYNFLGDLNINFNAIQLT